MRFSHGLVGYTGRLWLGSVLRNLCGAYCLTETRCRQLRDGLECSVGVHASSSDPDAVAFSHLQQRDAGKAPSQHGASPCGFVRDLDFSGESASRQDELGGRACRPCSLRMVRRSSRVGCESVGAAAPLAGVPICSRWSCSCLGVSARSASRQTSSRFAPARAWTAAAIAPSTSGAQHRRIFLILSGQGPEVCSRISRAISALSTELPKSIRTTAPSPSTNG